MADGQVIFETDLDFSGLKDGLKNADKEVGNSAGGMGKSFLSVGKIITTVLTGATAKAVLSVGTSFDTAMSQVAATMGTTVDQIQGLSDTAKKMGAETQFSATQAAEGLNYLALAGYTAEQAATALPTVLDLAAAGAMDLASASDMVTDAMGALNMEATEQNLTMFGDQMAKTASKSNTSVAQLGEAILTVGGTANVLSGGVTEMNTALGLLANVGLKGAEGGTHLRNVILSLSSPTKAAQKELKKLGVETTDASGNLLDMNTIMTDLNGALDGMGEAERAATLSKIFNKTDLTAVNGLLGQTGDAWSSLAEEIANSGGAMGAMAATQLDNLQGDVTIFKSAAEGLGIAFYEGFSGQAREIVQFGSKLVTELTQGMQDGGFDGLASSFGDVLAKAVTGLSEKVPTLVGGLSSVFASLFNGLGKNSGAISKGLASAVSAAISGLGKNLPGMVKSLVGLAGDLVGSLADELPTMISGLVEGAVGAAVGLIGDIPGLVETGFNVAKNLLLGIGKGLLSIPKAIGDSLQQYSPEAQAVDAILSINFTAHNEETVAAIKAKIDEGVEAYNTQKATENQVYELYAEYDLTWKAATEDGKITKKESKQLKEQVKTNVDAAITEANAWITEQRSRLEAMGASIYGGINAGFGDGTLQGSAIITNMEGLVTQLETAYGEYEATLAAMAGKEGSEAEGEIAKLQALMAQIQGLQAEIAKAMDLETRYKASAGSRVRAGIGTQDDFGLAIGYEEAQLKEKVKGFEELNKELLAAYATDFEGKVINEDEYTKKVTEANQILANSIEGANAEYKRAALELIDGMMLSDPEAAKQYQDFWSTMADIPQVETALTNMKAVENASDYLDQYGGYVTDLLNTDWFQKSGQFEGVSGIIGSIFDPENGTYDFTGLDGMQKNALLSAIMGAAKDFMDEVPELMEGIEGFENPIGDLLFSALGEDFDLTGVDTSGLSDGLASILKTINLQGVIDDAVKGGESESSAFDIGMAYVNQINQGIQSGSIDGETTTLVNNGITAGETATDGAYGIGSMLAAGIVAGLNGGAAAVSSAASRLVKAALAAARRGAQIESPSKLFRDVIGLNIAKGVAVGIDAGSDEVKSSMAGLVRGIVPDLSGVGLSGITARQRASMIDGIQQTINFNTEYVTPDLIAQTMREYANYGFARG